MFRYLLYTISPSNALQVIRRPTEVTTLRLLRTFTISDAVEGAVEVRMELADALREYRSRSRLLLLGLTVGVLLLVAGTVINVYWLAIETLEVVYGDSPLDLMYIGLSLVHVQALCPQRCVPAVCPIGGLVCCTGLMPGVVVFGLAHLFLDRLPLGGAQAIGYLARSHR